MATLPITSNPFLSKSTQTPFGTPQESVAHEFIVERVEVDLGALEDATSEVLEVRVSWGDQVLHVRHLDAQGAHKSLSLGEDSELKLPIAELGATSYEIARLSAAHAELRVPSGASRAWGVSESRDTWSMVGEDGAGFEIGAFVIELARVKRGHKPATAWWSALTESASRHIGLSMVLHAAVIGSLAFFMPSLGADDAEALGHDQMLMMRKYLDASAEKAQKEPENQGQQAGEAGDVGERARGESGAMGSQTAARANARWAKRGPEDNPNPALSRAELKAEIVNSGFIGLLASSGLSDPNAPTSPWGQLNAQGRDPESFNGNMWGASMGDALGAGGLDLSGTGDGGGGSGLGVGLGEIGFGHGNGHLRGPGGIGTCTGDNCGIGHGRSALRGGHQPKKFTMKAATTTVNGRLPAEVIQRVVRQNNGRFRNCYEGGLRTNPGLSGRVATRFVIDRNGAVSMAQNSGSDLPDQAVVQCVVRSFSNLSFPAPEGGIVTVTYPILFQPGE